MRELKFRAWVYYGQKLEKPHYSRDYASLDRFFEDHDENDTDQCIEQYTGLKDKNGKNIYEGDIIVDFDEYISIVDGNCAVISEKTCREKHFDEDDCSLERRTRPLIWVVNDYGYYPEKKETQVEVIGNIHENPELLEEEE